MNDCFERGHERGLMHDAGREHETIDDQHVHYGHDDEEARAPGTRLLRCRLSAHSCRYQGFALRAWPETSEILRDRLLLHHQTAMHRKRFESRPASPQTLICEKVPVNWPHGNEISPTLRRDCCQTREQDAQAWQEILADSRVRRILAARVGVQRVRGDIVPARARVAEQLVRERRAVRARRSRLVCERRSCARRAVRTKRKSWSRCAASASATWCGSRGAISPAGPISTRPCAICPRSPTRASDLPTHI